MKVLEKIRGKRTYVLAGLSVITTLVLWAVGDISGGQAVQQVLAGLGLGTLRAAFPAPQGGKVSVEVKR